MATPSSKADMDPNFEKQLKKLRDHAKDQYEARRTGAQTKWFRPKGWNGDPTDLAGLAEPFSRSAANDALVKAISDPKSPGTTGDVIACSVMIDYLSTLQRGFVVRHTMRRVRATAHAMGRDKGHGDDQGPFIQLGLEYVRGILKQAKKEGS